MSKALEVCLDSAYCQHRHGEVEAALCTYEEVLRRDPRNAAALHYRAMACFHLGRTEEAIVGLRASVAIDPRRVGALCDLGRVYDDEGRHAEAVLAFEAAVAADPTHADSWHNLGILRLEDGDDHGALTALSRALSIEPTRADSLYALARILLADGQWDKAMRAYDLGVRANPRDVEARLSFARLLPAASNDTRVDDVYRAILADHPQSAPAWVAWGGWQEDRGRRDDALSCYRKAIAADPQDPTAIGRVVALDLGPLARPLSAAAEAVLKDTRPIPAETRALIGYGLGKRYEGAGDVDRAFRAYRIANEARRSLAGSLDRAALVARIDRLATWFGEDALTVCPAPGRYRPAPVFIVGLPRSGTTLTEQILAAHPSIFGAGELPHISEIAQRNSLSGEEDNAQPEVLHDVATLRHEAEAYLTALAECGGEQVDHVIDKAPLNFFHLGLIARMFPGATVIHCWRDPHDTCLSIYAENFAASQTYATDLGDLGFFWGQYDRLMEHWRRVLPLRLLDIQYEETVANLRVAAERLCDFVGVPWNDRCLEFHRQNRTVRTPSRWQVRQPIYDRSVGRHRAFGDRIAPLAEALIAAGWRG